MYFERIIFKLLAILYLFFIFAAKNILHNERYNRQKHRDKKVY